MLMRDTVYCLVKDGDTSEITAAIEEMVANVQDYVKGYRLKQMVQIAREVPGLAMRVILRQAVIAGWRLSQERFAS